jgi:SnoaL-like domain
LSGNPGNFVAQPKRFRGVPSRIETACDALKFSHELKNTRIAALFTRHPALPCVFFSTQTRNERTFYRSLARTMVRRLTRHERRDATAYCRYPYRQYRLARHDTGRIATDVAMTMAAPHERERGMSTRQQQGTIEERLRAVEDKLAIYHLIASHPPAADTGSPAFYREAFTDDGTMDLAGGKAATGNEDIAAMVETPEHRAAVASGLCHFAGLPRVTVNGDTAIAISYLQIITPYKGAPQTEVPGHGTSSGFRIHRAGANRWELARTPDGWKVTRRTLRPLDGSQDARDLLRQAIGD